MPTTMKQIPRCAQKLLLASILIAGSTAIQAASSDSAYHWTRAELKTQSDLVVQRLKTLPAHLPKATALLVCPGVVASGTSTSECLLEEDGYWRAYYQLEVASETWRTVKAPQAVVYVLHTSKAFTHLLRTQAWSAQNDQALSAADFSVLLVTPNKIEVTPSLQGAKLKKIMM